MQVMMVLKFDCRDERTLNILKTLKYKYFKVHDSTVFKVVL